LRELPEDQNIVNNGYNGTGGNLYVTLVITFNKRHKSQSSGCRNDSVSPRESLQIGLVVTDVFTQVTFFANRLLAALKGTKLV
jgi:hypothetical protein